MVFPAWEVPSQAYQRMIQYEHFQPYRSLVIAYSEYAVHYNKYLVNDTVTTCFELAAF